MTNLWPMQEKTAIICAPALIVKKQPEYGGILEFVKF